MFAKFLKAAAAGALLVGALAAPAMAQKTKLTVYTALENDQLAAFKAEIEKAVPDVEVEWVRDSTGVITARFLAEKDNPKADIVLGLAASSLLLFKKAGLLEAYQPKGVDALKPAFRSSDGSWTGQDAFLGVICYNTVEGQKAGATPPKSWKDLTDPKFKDKLVMPHPASSGTGYLTVARLDPADGRGRGAGSSWTPCTRTWPSIPIRAARRACRPPRASASPASRFDMRARQGEDRRRADRDRLPDRGHRLGHGGHAPSSRERRRPTPPRRSPTGP